MANLGRWQSTTLTTVMSTELNSLANGSFVTSSASYDNGTNLNMYADFELFLASQSWSTELTATCRVAIFEAVDGINFAAPLVGGNAILLNGCFLGGTTALRMIARNVQLPPTQLKFSVLNSSNVAFPASGNTLKILTYGWNTNA